MQIVNDCSSARTKLAASPFWSFPRSCRSSCRATPSLHQRHLRRSVDDDVAGAAVVRPLVEVPGAQEQPRGAGRRDETLLCAGGIQAVADEEDLLELRSKRGEIAAGGG